MEELIIAREEYEASTGQRFVLIQRRDPNPAKGWPDVFWYWTWPDGRGYGIARLHDRHLTRESAIARIEQEERIRMATEGVPSRTTREEYEAACVRAGVPARTDENILRSSYGLTYGQFAIPEYTPEQIIDRRLALTRLRMLEAEQAAAMPKPAPVPYVECPYCGRLVSERVLMTASFGLACPDCYDEASEHPPRKRS